MRFTLCIALPLSAFISLVCADTEILIFERGDIQALPTLPAHADHTQSHPLLELAKPLTLFANFSPVANSSYAEKSILLGLKVPKVDYLDAKGQKLWSFLQPKCMIRVSWPASVPADVRLSLFMSQEQQFCLLIQLARSSVVSAYPHLAKSVNLPYTVILERVHLGFIPEASASLLAALLTVVGLIVTLRLPQKAWQLLRESDRTQDEQKDHVD